MRSIKMPNGSIPRSLPQLLFYTTDICFDPNTTHCLAMKHNTSTGIFYGGSTCNGVGKTNFNTMSGKGMSSFDTDVLFSLNIF